MQMNYTGTQETSGQGPHRSSVALQISKRSQMLSTFISISNFESFFKTKIVNARGNILKKLRINKLGA